MGPRGQAFASVLASGLSGFGALPRAALLEEVALAVHLEDVDVVGYLPRPNVAREPKERILASLDAWFAQNQNIEWSRVAWMLHGIPGTVW